MSSRAVRAALAAFAVLQLVTGALLWFTPGFFYDRIGPFGPRNDHYMGDLATWYLALGAVVFVSVRRPAWRAPVLAVAILQSGLHAVNHAVDVGEADPTWLGPATLVSLTVLTLVIALMYHENRKHPG